MIATDPVTRYFDAWNSRDAKAIAATFAGGGTYEDPTTEGPVSGDGIVKMAESTFAFFPDVRFDVVSRADIPGGVAAQWRMVAYDGAFDLPGADFIEVEGGAVKSVRGYFDRQETNRQLSKVLPVQLGINTYFTAGKTVVPGAFSVTNLKVGESRQQHVADLSQAIVMEMMGMEGFIGFLGSQVGDHMMTLTAWADVESAHRSASGATHSRAAQELYDTAYAEGGMLAVLVPESIRLLRRCPSCNHFGPGDACAKCGTALLPVPYF